jgi:hypothetical protein
MKSLGTIKLRECCTKFANTFSFDGSSDVDLNDLISELSVLQLTLLDKPMSAMDIFEYVREVDSYRNTSIAYRLLFTVPVTIALAERSFSKLKLLKNYLRSKMSQERLNGLLFYASRKYYWMKLILMLSSMTSLQDILEENFKVITYLYFFLMMNSFLIYF